MPPGSPKMPKYFFGMCHECVDPFTRQVMSSQPICMPQLPPCRHGSNILPRPSSQHACGLPLTLRSVDGLQYLSAGFTLSNQILSTEQVLWTSKSWWTAVTLCSVSFVSSQFNSHIGWPTIQQAPLQTLLEGAFIWIFQTLRMASPS